MELKGSKTEQNLLAGFAGESMAKNRYEFYASQADKEGYEQIADIFRETAWNERSHAKNMLQYCEGIGDTLKNLKAAAYGEHEEWSVIYKESAEVAREEGFEQIAKFFDYVSSVEKEHEERFNRLAQRVESQTVFKEDSETQVWICRNCGYIHVGKEAPKGCPLCKHPQAYFERKADNY